MIKNGAVLLLGPIIARKDISCHSICQFYPNYVTELSRKRHERGIGFDLSAGTEKEGVVARR